jgi:hypothetical protein
MSQHNESSTQRMQTGHGIVELTATSERVLNNDNSTSDMFHWSIRMSRDQSSPAPTMEQLGYAQGGQEMINESAAWLRYEGNLNGLEPRTVVIASNTTHGGSYTARWHGSDAPDSGRITEFLVPTYRGMQEVPREVLDLIPSERLTDVIRPGGTEINLLSPQNGSEERWSASFLDEQNRRVDLVFADNNELAIRRLHSGNGVVTTYGPGDDDLPRRSDALTVPQGGRTTVENGVTTVINQNGDVRTQWVRNAEGGYNQIRQIEHLEVDGNPSPWRVSQDTTNNTASIYRVDENNRVIGQPVGLSIGSDNSLIIPRTGETDALDVSSLRMPSGRNITIVAPTVERSDSDITTRQVPLTANSTRYSARETIEERAGYEDALQAPWQQRQMEITRSAAGQLNIPVPAGQDSLIMQMEVLPQLNATGRYSMRDGTELYANPAGDRLVVGSANTQTRMGAQVQVTEFDNAFLVPSNGRPPHLMLRDLANQGLEPVAVLGTGFITPEAGENGTKVIGYHYTNFARLEEGQQARQDIPPTELRDPNNGTNLRAGYWVDAKGEMHLLEFDRERYPQPEQVNAELERMKNDPNVVAINLFSHRVADRPEELIGGPPYDPDRGEPGWTPRPQGTTDGQYDTDRSNNLESRSFLAFGDDGRFLGRVSTPPISMRDTLSVAQEMYGPNVRVLNGDGDFYARAWYLDGRSVSDARALSYENAMILVRPTPDGQPAQLRELNDTERSEIRDYRRQEGIVDNINDIWKRFQRNLPDRQLLEDIFENIPTTPPTLGNAPATQGTSIASTAQMGTAQMGNDPQATSVVHTPPVALTAASAPTPPSITEDRRFSEILASVSENPRLSQLTESQRANLTGVLTLDADQKKLQPQLTVALNDQGSYAFAVERHPARAESSQYALAELPGALSQPLAHTDHQYRQQQTLATQTAQPDANVRNEDIQRSSQRMA